MRGKEEVNDKKKKIKLGIEWEKKEEEKKKGTYVRGGGFEGYKKGDMGKGESKDEPWMRGLWWGEARGDKGMKGREEKEGRKKGLSIALYKSAKG